jgi:hypothetical protein
MKNVITANWEDLLESLSDYEEELRTSGPATADATCASLKTLCHALSGIGRAWQEIARQIPDPAPESTAPEADDTRFTPQRAYTRPLAKALIELGAPKVSPAIRRVGELMAGQLTAGDLGRLPKSRQIRWETNVRFARDMLRARGLLVPPDGSNRWKLTPAGEKWARSSEPLPELGNPDQTYLNLEAS